MNNAAAEPATIRVIVPARSEFLHLVRLGVAGAMSDRGFSVAEIDDTKIAVEELAATLLRVGGEDELEVAITLAGDEASVSGRRQSESETPVTLDDFVVTILDAVVDGYSIENTGAEVVFSLRKRSRER